MVRTAQTAGLSQQQSIYHTQAFTDHAGQAATRVRYSGPSEPIPSDFHAQPIFTFQIYTTVSLDLDERSAKRSRTAGSSSDGERTVLTDLINYVGLQVASEAQRPPPLWEIYAEQPSVFTCVEHQRREIAHRKAQREERGNPPIPKVVQGPHGGDKAGFLIIIDSHKFKAGALPPADEDGAQGPLWVHFERKFPPAISWEPRLRLEADPETMQSGIFGPPEPPTVLAERIDATFQRIQRSTEMRSDLGMMYFASCNPSDPPPSVQEMMDVGWNEDEGTPEAERARSSGDASATLQSLAARLSVDDFNIHEPAATDVVISNTTGTPEPDLRYVIYVPFLHQPGMGDKLEQVAKAFTQQITSRLSGQKTISFEFYKPPSKDLSSVLAVHREKCQSENYIGALTTFPNKSGEHSEESSSRVRAYPIARTEHAVENDPVNVPFEPYRTFAVVLERPDFSREEGCVLFLLADGGKPKPNADQDLPPSMKPELQNYVEMELWRCPGMDEVTRRLQMVWGGVKWEQGAEVESRDGHDAEGEVEREE